MAAPTRSEPPGVLVAGGRATVAAVLAQLAGCVPAGSVITVVDPAAVGCPDYFGVWQDKVARSFA